MALEDNGQIKNTEEDNIIFLSQPSNCHMADEYYELATHNHFWIQWRFWILKHFLSQI